MVGRDRELERLQAFVAGGFTPTALMLEGAPGIGKTTLWEAGLDVARGRGVRVVATRSAEAEATLSFAGLIDLADGLEFDALPAPQRAALEVVLLRRAPGSRPPEPHAIGLGLRNALVAHAPILVAVDDLQWLDMPSAGAIAFAARRLTDQPVGFLLARRHGEPSALERALERRALERLTVGPLGLQATRRVLYERLAFTPPAPLLRRIVDVTLGNPLFALELARALAERGLPESDAELPVPAAVEDMLGTRVSRAPATAQRLLLAVALASDLYVDELETLGPVEDAVDAGLVLVDGDRVRAAHPLLAAAARTAARPSERRAVQRALAALPRSAEHRALHLALAAARPDDSLAQEVAAAAAGARARGARPEAVTLAEQALRLGAPSRRTEHLLTLAACLEAAGDRRRVKDLLTRELESLPPGAPRVRAWLLLSEADVRTRAEYQEHVARALAEAGEDPALRAHVLALKALNTVAEGVERIPEAEAWALEALPVGGEAERLALSALSWTRSLRGLALDDIRERFGHQAEHIVDSPEPVAGLRNLWRGELAPARATTEHFLALAAERGEGVSYAWLRLNLCELELRAGEWDAAERMLDEWAETDDGVLLVTPTYRRCRALLAAGRGRHEEAARQAALALVEAEARGYTWQVLEASRALGIAALLAHEPARAAEHLRAVWEHTQREGIEEPGAFPVAGELVEALTELGELDDARAVTERLPSHDHPWGEVTRRRCQGFTDGDAEALAEAAVGYERLGLRFDAARCLLSCGRAQRRARRWRAARDALEQAAAAFDVLGSPGWAADATAELTRVGGRKPRAAGELTASEQQVAALAAQGLTNKEIAHALFVTVHTVEAHLSNTYAKLGVRSRAQLAARL